VALQAASDVLALAPPRPFPRVAPCYAGSNASLAAVQRWSSPGKAAGTTVCSTASVDSQCWNVQNSAGQRVILWAEQPQPNELFMILDGKLTSASAAAKSCIGADPTTGELVIVEGCTPGRATSGWAYDAATMQIRVADTDGTELCVEWFANGTGGSTPPAKKTGVCANGCLFDVASDYTEQTNLIDDPAQAIRIANMTAILAKERSSFFSNKDTFVNDCPPGEKNCACWMATNRYGGFMGPFAMLPKTPAAQV
jgi:hypothetical protein